MCSKYGGDTTAAEMETERSNVSMEGDTMVYCVVRTFKKHNICDLDVKQPLLWVLRD